jgi:hypothetical protein
VNRGVGGGKRLVLPSSETKVPRGRDNNEEEGLEGAYWYSEAQ